MAVLPATLVDLYWLLEPPPFCFSCGAPGHEDCKASTMPQHPEPEPLAQIAQHLYPDWMVDPVDHNPGWDYYDSEDFES
jgi:hypothetical protein